LLPVLSLSIILQITTFVTVFLNEQDSPHLWGSTVGCDMICHSRNCSIEECNPKT